MAHGINIREQSTSVTAINVADSALPVIFGTAPVNMLENPTLNEPVLCLSYSEAVKAFGSIKDNNDYSLLQAIEILYSLYGISKAVFVNVLDKAKHKKTQSEAAYTFTKDKVELPHVGILKETVVVKADAEPATVDVDYTLAFNEYGKLIITRVAEGSLLAEDELTVQYDYIDISMVTADDIIGGIDAETGKKKGLEVIADVFPAYAVIPTLILAPGYSHLPGVAQSMAAKCKNISGPFSAVAIADIYDSTIKSYSKVPEYKNNKSLIDTNLIVCFPKVTNAGKEQWLSTHLAGVIAVTDSNNSNAPHVSPSNQSAKIDGLINNGEVVKLGLDEANYLNENGIVTALNFIGGFKIWGNRTSAYPSNTDVKDMFIPVRRVFGWVSNTIITNFWQKVDIPATKRNIDNVIFTIQTWVDGLAAAEVLLGATITFPDDLNPLTDMLNGKFKFKLTLASPIPMEDIEFILEFDTSLLNNLF